MILDKSSFTIDQDLMLVDDAEFQRRVGGDQELDRCFTTRDRPDGDAAAEAMLALGADVSIGNVAVRPPTAGTLYVLDMINSPFVLGGVYGESEIDQALWVLAHRGDSFKRGDIKTASMGSTRKTGADASEASDAIQGAIRVCLHPLDLMPEQAGPADRSGRFDLEWLYTFSGSVALESGKDIHHVMWDMCLLSASWHYVIACKRQGLDLDRSNRQEQGFQRLYQMKYERLVELGKWPT